MSPLGHIDPATWAEVLDLNLNLTANWRLIRAMDPLLRTAPAGRAIFVTSGVARGVFPYRGSYAVSKAGLEMLVKIYAGEISKTRVRANLIDPGIVRTRLRACAFPGEDAARERGRRFSRPRPARMRPQRRSRLGVVPASLLWLFADLTCFSHSSS